MYQSIFQKKINGIKKRTYTIYNLILFQKSMLSYQSIVKKAGDD